MEGLIYGGKSAFQNRLGKLIVGRKFTVILLCFTLYLRAISKYKPPRGLIFGGLIFGILRYFREKFSHFCLVSVFFIYKFKSHSFQATSTG